MENVKILMADTGKIPCIVCKGECLNKGWHLANGNFCSTECMCDFINNINLIFVDMEENIKTLENRINKLEARLWNKTKGTRPNSTK
jgi:hypothetical protein